MDVDISLPFPGHPRSRGRGSASARASHLRGSPWVDVWRAIRALDIYFADTPSAGHDLLALDYRECGPGGEPRVVHVDQEAGHVVTPMAPSFGDFLDGLVVDSEVYPDTPDC